MPAFLDTSALLKYFVEETGTDEVTALIESATDVWVSELTTVEGVSALAKKVRKTEIMEGEFRRLIGQFTQFLSSGRCEIVPIDDEVREAARTILGTWALTHKLGSLDALQLGAALRVKEVVGPLDFYSSDRRLLAAAQAQGFTVKNPGVA